MYGALSICHIYGIWDLEEQRDEGFFKVTIWGGNARHKPGRGQF